MIDINPTNCIRSAEEMALTRRALLHQADVLTDVSSALRSSSDESMQSIARTVERYVADIQFEGRAAETLSLMLSKIAESYLRAERDTNDYADQVYIKPVIYGTIVLGDVAMRTKELFEVF